MKTKSEAVAAIGGLIAAVSGKFDADVDAEREYLAQRLPGTARTGGAYDLDAGVHLLAAIAEGGTVNVVGLAEKSEQLKGTVSKHVQRLVDSGLVIREPLPGNRKEIQLSLTADGGQVVEVHRQMHDEIAGGLRDFLMRYDVDELAVLTKVLDDLLRTERQGVRLVPGPIGTDR